MRPCQWQTLGVIVAGDEEGFVALTEKGLHLVVAGEWPQDVHIVGRSCVVEQDVGGLGKADSRWQVPQLLALVVGELRDTEPVDVVEHGFQGGQIAVDVADAGDPHQGTATPSSAPRPVSVARVSAPMGMPRSR